MKRLIFLPYVFIAVILLSSCGSDPQKRVPEAAFSQYISGYTSSAISSEGEVVVRLASDYESKAKAGEELFDLSPSVKGSQVWLDEQTVAFRPADGFKSGTKYQVDFALSKLTETPDSLEHFIFNFETIKQDLEVNITGISPVEGQDRSRQQITGQLYTADVAGLPQIKKVVKAEQGGVDLAVEWEQDASRRTHYFRVQDVRRGDDESKVTISWNGEPVSVSGSGRETVFIPSLKEFKMLRLRTVRDTNPHLELRFSDRLDPSQNLNGLITLDDKDELNFIINENRIEVYPRSEVQGEQTLNIAAGIKNNAGERLKKDITETVRLFQIKPQVRWVGNGVIIPNSEELLLPFEAAGLGAIDVQITRVFANNVLQFLQYNQLTGGSSLREVGRTIHQQVIPLSTLGSVDTGSWQSYALDISKFIKPQPGAVYRVEIGFRKYQSLYPCGNNSAAFEKRGRTKWEVHEAEEEAYWADFDDYYPDNFSWSERDNPCNASYFYGARHVERNALASDIGLIAKRGETGSLLVITTDLKSAEPMPGVTLELYDYQKQKLKQVSTGGEGMATIEAERKPFFIQAKKNNQRGYLRLEDGASLSLSDFDVSGATVKDGIKGYLYAERGVWRPGDSLFVSLMVEDEQEVLPDNHPVIFELRNPSGQLYDRQVITKPLNGLYSFDTKTGTDSPTGAWRVTAALGGNSFTKLLRIETVKPNRLKVELDFADERLTASDRTLNGTIASQWLHGATAGNLDTDMSMTLFKETVSFEGYPNFTFNDPSNDLDAGTEEIFRGEVNSKGTVDFSYTLNKRENAPGKLRASLLTRVFEESGNFSVNRSSIAYYPYPNFVGLRLPESKYDWAVLDRDSTHNIDIATLDIDGKPVALNNLNVQVYEVQWSWWWEKSGQNLSQYIAKENVTPVLSKTVSTDATGKGAVRISLDDYSWGRFLIKVSDPKGGYSAGKTFYLGWGYGRNNNEAGSPTRLTFDSDKDRYEVGEEVTINFPSSSIGRALVSLETGSRRLQTYWVDTEAGETSVRFTADKAMAPNVYAHIMMVQPHGQQQNDRPLRMYGVIPLEVEDPATQLQPVVEMPDELRPETETSITVSEQNGKAMTYTVAMVDEGLLDLTNFKTPAPHPYFYAREALGVKTWDLFDDVAGAYAGSMNRILSIGGDQALEDVEQEKNINRFKPMVEHLGPFHLEAGQTKTHTIDMPNYVGSVRTMVVAGYEGAYGHAEEATPVRKPVMVLGTLPRVLGPGERVSLPVSVFAMKENIKKTSVRIAASDIFKVIGPSEKTVAFDQPGDKIARFELEVKSRVGAGRVEMMVSSGAETAHHEIDIEVRNPNPPVTNVYEKVLEPGESWAMEYNPVGLIGTNSGVFEVSRIPPIDLGRRLRYLIRYPHGCIEQVTSSVFPQLYLGVIMDVSDERMQRIEKNVKAAIEKLRTFQVSSGGFGYWANHNTTNEWGTSYAYHFLLEAKQRGYYIPSDMLQNAARYQSDRARNWRFVKNSSRHNDLVQAYRLYTLALANAAELGAMNRLRERGQLSVQAVWRLAAAYALAGQAEAARELVQGADTDIQDYEQAGNTYGSATRDKAMILETLSIMDRRDQAAVLMKDIANKLNEDRWMSTQTTAYSLIGIARFLKIAQGTEQVEVQYDISNAGEGSISSTAPVSQVPFTIDGEEQQSVRVTNNSEGIVFARLMQEGTPLIGDQTSASNGLTQQVSYFNRDGDEVNPADLEQGADIIVEVQLTNPGTRGSYQDLALTQIFPSGWEITNARMDDIKFDKPTSTFEYQDIRDDRVYTYFDLDARKTKVFRFLVNASYLGRFYLPTVETSAMYDNSINARTPGRWVEINLPE